MEPLLEALQSDDAGTLVRAIEEGAVRLRAEQHTRGDVEPIVRAIVGLAVHARAKVRQAVAEAALHLPDDAYEAVITRVLKDSNAYVKRAATRSYDERSRRERVSRECEARSAGVLRMRARLGKTYSADALRLADEICDRMTGQFVDGLLHELIKVADPMSRMIARIETEAEVGGRDGARLAALAKDAGTMLKLLVDIAESARSHAEVAEPTYRDTSVQALVDEQLALLRGRIGDARAGRLRVETDVDVALTVEADRVLLAQALSNLLQNAVEAYAIDAEGPIVVRIRAEHRKVGGLVAVTVEDVGGGVPEREVKRIGEPFVSTKGEGRGLGLLNVRKMIEVAHGGSLDIHSELGVGTRVVLVLPRKQGARGVGPRSRDSEPHARR